MSTEYNEGGTDEFVIGSRGRLSCESCARRNQRIADLERQLRERDNAIALAYGYLWHVNNEPGTPQQYSPERAAYGARKVLRNLLDSSQRGYAINAVRGLIETELRDYEARKPK